jgi:TPR repeat protein
MTGKQFPADTSEAIRWITKAAEKNNRRAMYDLAYMYDNGKGVEKDTSLSLKWYKDCADAGDAACQNNLGIKYRRGRWMKRDYDKAFKLFKRSADQNYPFGIYNLGLMYEQGKGVKQDDEKALALFQKAVASSNKTGAGYYIGIFYEEGRGGLPQDYKLAMEWYKKSLNYNAYCFHLIGKLYEKGRGVEVDSAEAIKWYKRSADADVGFGMYYLGNIYSKTDSVMALLYYQRAAVWFKKDIAKNLDNTQSMMMLASMYENGKGVTANKKLALEFYELAAYWGDRDAFSKIEQLKN